MLASILSALLIFSAHAKVTADQVIKKLQHDSEAPNETAEIALTITERDGSKKVREITIKKKNSKKHLILVKILTPPDLKGVGLLSEVEGEDETQRLYLPSEKRSRRIVSDNKGGRFLDSDLSYEDLSVKTYHNFNNSIEGEKKAGKHKIILLKSVAKSPGESSYGMIKTWVKVPEYQVTQSQYFDFKKKLKKTMKFQNYKKYGRFWRAQDIYVSTIGKNKKPQRTTHLKLNNLSLKSLDEGEFSISALEE